MTRRFKVAGTAVLGTILAVGAVGAAMAAQPGPAYLAVQSWSADAQGQNSVRLSATTTGDIPRLTDAFIASQIIVGIAWADLGTGTALSARQASARHSHSIGSWRRARGPSPTDARS